MSAKSPDPSVPAAAKSVLVNQQAALNDHGHSSTQNKGTRVDSAVKATTVVRCIGFVVVLAVVLGAAQWQDPASASDVESEASDSAVEFECFPTQYAFRASEFDDPAPAFLRPRYETGSC